MHVNLRQISPAAYTPRYAGKSERPFDLLMHINKEQAGLFENSQVWAASPPFF
jgi:hypothetical protein